LFEGSAAEDRNGSDKLFSEAEVVSALQVGGWRRAAYGGTLTSSIISLKGWSVKRAAVALNPKVKGEGGEHSSQPWGWKESFNQNLRYNPETLLRGDGLAPVVVADYPM